jgi:hypothetical protein
MSLELELRHLYDVFRNMAWYISSRRCQFRTALDGSIWSEEVSKCDQREVPERYAVAVSHSKPALPFPKTYEVNKSKILSRIKLPE